LFVFLLVVGCGFGLIFAYLTYFGGSLDFANERALQTFYIVCGSVAVLGLLGYIAVVSSARPMEGVARGNKRREKLLKRFGQIRDVRDVNLKDFAGEPALQDVLERWLADSGAASDALRDMATQRQAIASLTQNLTATAGEALSPPVGNQPELSALVESINNLIRELPGSGRSLADGDAAPVQSQRVGAQLHDAQLQIFGFADSIAHSADELRDLQGELGGGPSRAGGISDALARATQRLAHSRQTLEALCDESNRLAIAAALQVSRLGEPGAELLRVTEAIRSLSTQYQRLAAELRQSEGDHEALAAEWARQAPHAGRSGAATPASEALREITMILDQSVGGLEELAAQLAQDAQALTGIAPQPRPQRAPRARRPAVATVQPEIEAPALRVVPQPPLPPDPTPARKAAPSAQAAPRHSAPVVPISAPRKPVEIVQSEIDEIYEMAELGGRELDESGEPIYELLEFGAVQI
jgi:hypothetical protein